MTTLEEDARAKAIANEMAKLTATYVNSLAAGIFVVGALGPLFSYLFAAGGAKPSLLFIASVSGLCQIASVVLHIGALRVLRRIRP